MTVRILQNLVIQASPCLSVFVSWETSQESSEKMNKILPTRNKQEHKKKKKLFFLLYRDFKHLFEEKVNMPQVTRLRSSLK